MFRGDLSIRLFGRALVLEAKGLGVDHRYSPAKGLPFPFKLKKNTQKTLPFSVPYGEVKKQIVGEKHRTSHDKFNTPG